MKERRPRVFIGSSKESLEIANAINSSLDHDMEPTVWKDGIFKLSQHSIPSLVQYADSTDFAIFVFMPDDIAQIKKNDVQIVRDNVLFELGLFIGAIGQNRCIIVKPRDTELHFPSDLLGVTTANYNCQRSDNNLVAAVNAPCTEIRKHIKDIGLRSDDPNVAIKERKRLNLDYEIKLHDFRLLAQIYECNIGNVETTPIWGAFSRLENEYPKAMLGISLLKLERLGYVDKKLEIDQDHGGVQYYGFYLTEDGCKLLLDKEDSFVIEKTQTIPIDLSEPIPF